MFFGQLAAGMGMGEFRRASPEFPLFSINADAKKKTFFSQRISQRELGHGQ
jgi:hypothetical protein